MTRQNKNFLLAIATAVTAVAIPQPGFAQQKPTTIAPATPLKDGWEEIDQRLVFLMIRLANTETTLDAVEKALKITTRQEKSSVADVKRAEQGNERMDRQGGGPLKWSEFYGRTAEKFFYHPVDQSTTYHTATILSQQQSMPQQRPGAVPGYQGVPLSQRPPQFDYIYKANEDAKARAEKEAADMRSKREALMARRKNLEEEQSALWCEIAFRAVSHYDLDREPLYRFEPQLPADADATTKQHAEVTKAAVMFMRRALSVVSEAQKDQGTAFSNIKLVVSDGRDKLDDAWLRQAVDTSDRTTPETRFVTLAKRLEDVSGNLADSYKVSIDGDRFKDEVRKNTFRGLLQESLVNYAEVLLALDEMSVAMARQWKFKPDVDKPLAGIGGVERRAAPETHVSNEPQSLDDLSQWHLPANSKFNMSRVFKSIPDGAFRSGDVDEDIFTNEAFKNFEVSLEYRYVPHGKKQPPGGGLLLRASTTGYDNVEVQISEDATGDFYVQKGAQLNTAPERVRSIRINNTLTLDRRLRSSDAHNLPADEWNELRVRCDGDSVTVWLNGKEVNSGHSFNRVSGPFGLKDQSTEIMYRDIRVQRLAD